MPDRTTPPPTAPPTSPADATDTSDHGRSPWAVAAVLTVVLAILGGWIYALFVYRPARQLDELADRTFPVAAEKVCARTMRQVDALPPASTARTATERAEVVEQADRLLRSMVDELRGIAPAGDDRASAGVREWVDDWGRHVADRSRYAATLRKDADARFLESTKGTRQLSRAIDGFAEVNQMDSCATPGDVG